MEERIDYMKKIFVLLALPLISLTSCRPDPAAPLPHYDGKEIALTPEVSGLDTELSESNITVEFAIPDSEKTYEIEISSGCKYKTTNGGFKEIYLSPGSYIRSLTNCYVNRIIVDIFGKQGINFDVYKNNSFKGNPIQEHTSEITPTEPDDFGAVYEYPIEAGGWSIKNNTEFNKPCFYYVKVVF